jgi:hypothetical protein
MDKRRLTKEAMLKKIRKWGLPEPQDHWETIRTFYFCMDGNGTRDQGATKVDRILNLMAIQQELIGKRVQVPGLPNSHKGSWKGTVQHVMPCSTAEVSVQRRSVRRGHDIPMDTFRALVRVDNGPGKRPTTRTVYVSELELITELRLVVEQQ